MCKMLLMDIRDTAYMIDTETTGGAKTDQVIDLAVVSCKTGQILIDTLYKPTVALNEFARKVHGLTDADLRDAPEFADQAESLRALLQGKLLLAWNAAFDQRLMEQTFRAFNKPIPDVRWACAMTIYQRVKGLKKPPSLTNACTETGVKPGSHRALTDAVAAARVFWKLAHVYGDSDYPIAAPVQAGWTPVAQPDTYAETEAVNFGDADEYDSCGAEIVGNILIRHGWQGTRIKEKHDIIRHEMVLWTKGEHVRVTTSQALDGLSDTPRVFVPSQNIGIYSPDLEIDETSDAEQDAQREWMNLPRAQRLAEHP